MIAWLRDHVALRRRYREEKSRRIGRDLQLLAVTNDLAMWQELARCHNPQEHRHLAHRLHVAEAELQVLRGEDPHQASLRPVRIEREEGGVSLLAAIAALLVALLTVVVVLGIVGRINDGPVKVDASMSYVRPLAAAEPTTTTNTTAAPTITTTAAPARKAASTTTTPPVVPANDIEQAIVGGFARFGPAVARQAIDVADCESVGLNPTATGAAGERGLFQIHPDYHQERIARLGFTWDQMYEVGPNIAVAADLYAEQGWSPWTCAP